MNADRDLKTLLAELGRGMALSKCRKCGCMKGALEEMTERLADSPGGTAPALRRKVQGWLDRTEDSLYS